MEYFIRVKKIVFFIQNKATKNLHTRLINHKAKNLDYEQTN